MRYNYYTIESNDKYIAIPCGNTHTITLPKISEKKGRAIYIIRNNSTPIKIKGRNILKNIWYTIIFNLFKKLKVKE